MAGHGETAASGTVRPAGDVRRRVAAVAFVPSWLGVVATIAIASLLPSLPLAVRLLPLAVSAVVFGLPHGAVDHLALPRVSGERPDRRAIVRVVALYAVLGGAYAIAWLAAPVPAALSFVALTWLHWGQGDVYPLAALVPGDHPATSVERVLTAAVRGGLPMLVPLVAYPERYRTVVAAMAAPFTRGDPALSWLTAAPVGTATAAVMVALTVAALVPGVRHGTDPGFVVDVAEVGLLWALFLTVPPLLAVGAYFVVWHSPRHVARLIAVDDAASDRLRGGRPLAALGRFARDAAPTTAAALLVLAALYLLAPARPTTLAGFAGLYLAFIAVLTLPHVVVVTLMDREQGVWWP